MSTHTRTIPATDAAHRLGKSREAVVRLCQRGELLGLRDPRGRWQVAVASIDKYIALREAYTSYRNAAVDR